MGYVFLLASQICSGIKGYCGKMMSGFVKNVQGAVFMNMLRTVLCTAISLIVILVSGNQGGLAIAPVPLLISALSGVATAVFLASWLLCVRESAYMMLDVFLMLGTLVPTVVGYFMFSEIISLRQWIGFAILLLAVLIMCSYNNSIKVKITPAALALLILCGFANGSLNLAQKSFVKFCPDVSISLFNLYTYIFASLALGLFFLLMSRRGKVELDKQQTRRAVIYVLIMASMLTAHSYLITLAASNLDSMQLYPLDRGMSLVVTTLMATFVFKEKFKIRALVGIALAFAALMIINL